MCTLYIFGDQNGMCQWKPAQIDLMMLAWENYNMLQDFISPVIDNLFKCNFIFVNMPQRIHTLYYYAIINY